MGAPSCAPAPLDTRGWRWELGGYVCFHPPYGPMQSLPRKTRAPFFKPVGPPFCGGSTNENKHTWRHNSMLASFRDSSRVRVWTDGRQWADLTLEHKQSIALQRPLDAEGSVLSGDHHDWAGSGSLEICCVHIFKFNLLGRQICHI